MSNTSEEKVLKIMTTIESPKAAGVDKHSGRFLKDGANIIAKPICALCNLSISQGVFANACKVAKLKLIYINQKNTDPSNYRRISLLPLISKIFERVIHDQISSFLSDEDILYSYQSGFQGNQSTNLCFHQSTINKLSDFGKISCKVLQGSILGLLLFLIYVNDMPQAVKSTLLLHADDSCILFQHKDVKQIEKRLNEDFENLYDWFIDKKLSIHFGEDKTKSMRFACKRRASNIRH